MTEHAFLIVDKATFYRFAAAAPEHVRCEYVRGRIVQQMTGGTFDHVRLAKRIADFIAGQLDSADWIVSLSDRGVETSQTIRYPDVVMERAGAAGKSLSTDAPVLVVEVLSPSSEVRDLEAKPAEYTSLATLHAYIVASQDAPACLVWLRRADGTFAAEPASIDGRDEVIHIPALSVAIPLAEVYRGIGE